MQPRATFESVKTDDPDLFVVSITGHLGVKQRATVENLVKRCEETGKSRVIFDVEALESMAGSVASVLGDFATRMEEKGSGLYFVGASTVVESFLTARFHAKPPSFASSVETAREALQSAASVEKPEAREKPKAPEKPEPLEKPVADPAEAAPAKPKARRSSNSRPVPPARKKDIFVPEPAPVDEPLGAEDRAIADLVARSQAEPRRRRSHITLADAQPMLLEIQSIADSLPILEGLLVGADLASVCHLFELDGDQLQEIQSDNATGEHVLDVGGTVCAIVRRRGGPVDLVDIVGEELSESEAELIMALNCQLVAPIFIEESLAGIFFVRQEQAGREYLPSEELAIDLLARQFGLWLTEGRRSRDKTESEDEKKLKAQIRRQQGVFRIARELHGIDDAEQLVSRLLISMIGEMGVTGAVFLDVEGETLVPRHTYGIDESELGLYTIREPMGLRCHGELIKPEDADPKVWGDAALHLGAAGVDLLAPLCGREVMLGVIGLCIRRSQDSGNFDPEYLKAVLHQAGLAAQRVRTVRSLEDQTLRVARTLISLVDRRFGRNTSSEADLVSWYVSRLAEKLNYDEAERRDLLYGAVLRDVGMIEISDLVLKSPRSLTGEEWKLVQRHPIAGVEILRGIGFSAVTEDVVLHHHERFNGSGYPHGLREHAIPLGARIVSVVESYVAMLQEAPYRTALSPVEALDVLEENWEMRYDPEVVRAFADLVRSEPDPIVDHAVEALLADSVA